MTVQAQIAIIVLSWLLPFGALILAGPIVGNTLEIPLLGVALLVAITLSVRGTECGVDCTADTIAVRGWVRTVRIPTDAVLGVDQAGYALLWRDEFGDRRTRLFAFGRSRRGIDPHSRESLARLADWVSGACPGG
ncbi:hypothetical protein JJ691_41090 [Kutzneria sp. CA-103260]|nr:hypothetical protein JJ691_41090 [Kutzneria sp. CA-103260]